MIFMRARFALPTSREEKRGVLMVYGKAVSNISEMTTRVMGSCSGIGDCFFVFAFLKLVRHCVEVCRSVPDFKN